MSRLAGSLIPFRDVLSIPAIRRVEAAWLLFNAAEWAVWVAILVFAYLASGPASVSLVAVSQLVPAAIAAPTTARLGDRLRRDRALALAYLAVGTAMLVTGLTMLASAPPLLVYGLAASVVLAYTSIRPIQSAILPALVGRAEQLTAANATSTILEGAGVLVGPLLCGTILLAGTPAAVFLIGGAATLAAALLVATMRPLADLAPRPNASPDAPAPRERSANRAARRSEPGRRFVIALIGTRFGVAAAMDVLIVLAAIELLGMGQAGAGYLSAAIGLGWVLGGATTLAVVGRPRLTPLLLIGAIVWALPVAGVVVLDLPVVALVLFLAAGIGLAVVDVAARTILQRLVPIDRLAVTFGLAEGASMGGAAIGALGAGLLVALLELHAAVVIVAVVLPLLALAILPIVGRAEAAVPIPFRQIALLRRLRLFALVPAPALEAAASALVHVALPRDSIVIAEGDVGDRFYVIESGSARVSQRGLEVVTLGPGEGFGELALLRRIPRTATVVAETDLELEALDREAFLVALTASTRALNEASRVAAVQLERDDARAPGG